jgi:hypothetical protein
MSQNKTTYKSLIDSIDTITMNKKTIQNNLYKLHYQTLDNIKREKLLYYEIVSMLKFNTQINHINVDKNKFYTSSEKIIHNDIVNTIHTDDIDDLKKCINDEIVNIQDSDELVSSRCNYNIQDKKLFNDGLDKSFQCNSNFSCVNNVYNTKSYSEPNELISQLQREYILPPCINRGTHDLGQQEIFTTDLKKSISNTTNNDVCNLKKIISDDINSESLKTSNFGLDGQDLIWERIDKARKNNIGIEPVYNCDTDVINTSDQYVGAPKSDNPLYDIVDDDYLIHVNTDKSSHVNNLNIPDIDSSVVDIPDIDSSVVDIPDIDSSVVDIPIKYPTINAFHKLTPSDRKTCIKDIFITATNNVNEMCKLDTKYFNIFDDEVSKEADRLLETYLKTH